jgi:hypothetical protein
MAEFRARRAAACRHAARYESRTWRRKEGVPTSEVAVPDAAGGVFRIKRSLFYRYFVTGKDKEGLRDGREKKCRFR